MNQIFANMNPPLTREMTRRIQTMSGVISLAQGSPPSSMTPQFLKEAAAQAIMEGYNQYTKNSYGYPPLMVLLAQLCSKEFDCSLTPENFVIGAGATGCLHSSLGAILQPGDRVAVIYPAWEFGSLVREWGGQVVPIITNGSHGFLPVPDEIRNATKGCKAIIVNSLHNPTGRLYPADLLEAIAEIAIENDLLVINDETYNRIIFDGNTYFGLANIATIRDRLITVRGFSKVFAIAGWRVGYAVAPQKIMAVIRKANDCSILCAPAPFQVAITNFLENTGNYFMEMPAIYQQRRDVMAYLLKNMGLNPLHADGTYYMFVSYDGISSLGSLEFVEQILQRAKVAVLPAAAFLPAGVDMPFFRVCFASEEAMARDAADRLQQFIKG